MKLKTGAVCLTGVFYTAPGTTVSQSLSKKLREKLPKLNWGKHPTVNPPLTQIQKEKPAQRCHAFPPKTNERRFRHRAGLGNTARLNNETDAQT